MRKKVRILSILMVMSILAVLMAACGNTKTSSGTATKTMASSDAGSTAPAEKKPEQVQLTIITGGDQPDQPGFPAVAEEIAKVTADNINVKIDVQTYAWGDYINKKDTMLAAGQNVDIALDFYSFLKPDADKKAIIPLNDLIEQYGTDVKGKIPADIWNDVTYNGKIYGVPATYPFVGIETLMIRGDLREKYNLPSVTDLASFENYLDAVVKGEKGMVGFSSREGRNLLSVNYLVNGESTQYLNVCNTNLDYAIARVDITSKPYKVVNGFATPDIKKVIDWNRKAYANGWESKDILTQKDDQTLFTSGKMAAFLSDVYTINSVVPTMEANIPGCKVETVTIHDYNNMIRASMTNNFAVIPSTSKNPERAMMFLNWTRASQDNYNLLMYGIKGKDWVAVDDKTYEIGPGIDAAKRPYNPTPWWFKNQAMDLNLKGANPVYLKAYENVLAAKYTTPELISFSYDSAAMKAKIAQINTTMLEKWIPVLAGVLNSDADYQAALDALDKAGVPEVVADVQKQVDAWTAANSK